MEAWGTGAGGADKARTDSGNGEVTSCRLHPQPGQQGDLHLHVPPGCDLPEEMPVARHGIRLRRAQGRQACLSPSWAGPSLRHQPRLTDGSQTGASTLSLSRELSAQRSPRRDPPAFQGQQLTARGTQDLTSTSKPAPPTVPANSLDSSSDPNPAGTPGSSHTRFRSGSSAFEIHLFTTFFTTPSQIHPHPSLGPSEIWFCPTPCGVAASPPPQQQPGWSPHHPAGLHMGLYPEPQSQSKVIRMSHLDNKLYGHCRYKSP